MTGLTLVNGSFTESPSAQDRGLAYGDGLFDTLLVKNGRPILLGLHIERVINDAARLGIRVELKVLLSDIGRLLSASECCEKAVIKTTITRGAAGRGYAIPDIQQSLRIVSLSPLQDVASYPGGINVSVCDTRLGHNPQLAGIKHLCRLENILARNEFASNVQEGLMLDVSGNVIEGTMSNLFWVKADVLYTPLLDRCGVAGVIRKYVLETLAPALGLAVKQARYRLDELYSADEIFVTNSVIGLWSVSSIGCHKKTIGPWSKKIQQSLESLDA